MKKSILALLLFVFIYVAQAQTITGLQIIPANPTSSDNVQAIAECLFPSGGCSEWFFINQYYIGNVYTYDIMNCLGVLTVMCPYNDTINIGTNLPAGNYTVIINLNQGLGLKPCTPNSIWVSDTAYFTISPLTGIINQDRDDRINVYVDPSSQLLTIEQKINAPGTIISIYNIQGKLLAEFPIKNSIEKLNMNGYGKGIYFARITYQDCIAVTRFVKF